MSASDFFCRSFAFLSVVASREKYLLGLKTSSVATFYVKRAIVEKKVLKNLCIKKETSIFASQLRVATFRAFSSAGLEHLPYKQRVGGSNPSTPTESSLRKAGFFCLWRLLVEKKQKGCRSV